MEPLARKKLLGNLFLLVKLHMDPLVIVNTNFFVFHWVQLLLESQLLYFHEFFKCCNNSSNMEPLTKRQILRHLFLFVKLHMDPLVIVDINFFVFLLVQLSLQPYLLLLHRCGLNAGGTHMWLCEFSYRARILINFFNVDFVLGSTGGLIKSPANRETKLVPQF